MNPIGRWVTKSLASGAAISRLTPRLRSACLIIGLVLFPASVLADNASPSTSSSSLLTGRWSQLAQPLFRDFAANANQYPQIYAMALDGDGFLWLGSRRGLARWDGYHMHSYVADPKDPHAIQDNYVTVLHADSVGRVWVGTAAGGLSRYDRESDSFTTYSAGPTGLTHSSIYSIVGDGAGGLWIATGVGEGNGGLDHLDPLTGQFTHTFHEVGLANSLPDNAVRSLLLDNSDTLWVGTLKGLAKRLLRNLK